jgi:hypothetical protein
MGPRTWRQRRQASEKVLGLENQPVRTIAPRPLKHVHETAIVHSVQPVFAQRRPRHIAHQTFSPLPVAGRYGNIGVQAEAVHCRAAANREPLQAFRINAIRAAAHASSSSFSSGHPIENRRSVEARQPRLPILYGIGVFRFTVAARPLHQSWNPAGQLRR